MPRPASIFDEKTLYKLEQLELIARRVRAGAIKGERRSVKRGTSIEFADYRNYTRGDDLRRVDWNLFARLERPFLKLFEEEEDLAVHLLIDCSASMNFPRDAEAEMSHHKFRFAQRVTAGLAHISLGTGDRLTIQPLGGTKLTAPKSMRGRGRTLELLDYLGGLTPGGTVELNVALRDYASRMTRPGLCLIVTDMLSAAGYEDGLAALQGRGNEIAVIHILSPDEVTPPFGGDLQLVDAETGMPQNVSIDASMRDLYTRRLVAWRDEIERFCTKRGIHYAAVETSTGWEELILFELRRLGVVH